MFTRVCFGALALIALSSPAFAAGHCGIPPVAPAFVPVDQLLAMPQADAEAKVTSMNADLKTYLAQRTTYLACLDTEMTADKRDTEQSTDKAKLASLNQDYATAAKAYNATSDEGKQVGDAWNKIATSYCAKDPTFCKKN